MTLPLILVPRAGSHGRPVAKCEENTCEHYSYGQPSPGAHACSYGTSVSASALESGSNSTNGGLCWVENLSAAPTGGVGDGTRTRRAVRRGGIHPGLRASRHTMLHKFAVRVFDHLSARTHATRADCRKSTEGRGRRRRARRPPSLRPWSMLCVRDAAPPPVTCLSLVLAR